MERILSNAKNKEDLINIIVKFIKSNKGLQLINLSFVATVGDKIYGFQNGQEKVNKCNHQEADARIILLVSQETNGVVAVAKDPDVLLWFYLCGNMLINISNTVYSSNAENYANIRKICHYLGKYVQDVHARTGSDAT